MRCIFSKDSGRLLIPGKKPENEIASVCFYCTIYEASERDFRIITIKDAISGLYEQGEKEMRNIGVGVTTTRKLAERLR